MISAILIYGKRGEILSSRVYKDGLRRAVADVFRAQVIANAAETPTPLLTLGSTSFLHIRHNGLFVVAVTRHDVDGVAVLEFLYKLCDVIASQVGTFDEAACYRYVAEIYAILDELVDFGIPQNTEPGTLQLHSPQQTETNVVSSLKRSLTIGRSADNDNNTNSNRGGAGHHQGAHSNGGTEEEDVPWRRRNVKHRRNEVFLDVVERLNAVFDSTGRVLSASADGTLKVKAALSGVPQCRVDLERSEVLESSQLHACVDHKRFHTTGVVQFVPPEGEFELLRYRATRGISVPLSLSTTFAGGEQQVHLRNTLQQSPLANVVVLVPLPPSATSASHKARCSSGKARFLAEKTCIEWKIGRVPQSQELTLRIQSDLPLDKWGPTLAHFQVDMHTCTHLRVRSLQVVEKYSTLKWVRYLTESGAVELRM